MGTMATGSDWSRLSGFVLERRTDLGLTQEDVRAAGGPSTATMRLIEGGLKTSYLPAILRRLEDALRWEHGSVRRILAGGDPAPLEDPARAAAPQPAPEPAGPRLSVVLGLAEIAELAASVDDIEAGIRAEIAGYPEDAPGAIVFPASLAEQLLWDRPLTDLAVKIGNIVAYRLARTRTPRPRNSGMERAGLTRITA